MEDNEIIEEEDDLDPLQDDIVFKLGYWSKALSWVVLIGGALYVLFTVGKYLYSDLYQLTLGGAHLGIYLSMLAPQLVDLIGYVVYFFLLQAVGEVLYLAIDMREVLDIEDL